MVATPSTMLALGTEAPAFTLPDASGTRHDLDDLAGAAGATVVMFLSNHCPYVHHIGAVLGEVCADLQARGAAVIGIMSNDVDAYPDDAPALMPATAERFGWTFPYLYDETQDVARAYHAACTPDLFVFDARRRLAYRGQFDGSRPGNDVKGTGESLRTAVESVLAGRPPEGEQLPSMGCNIKWRP
ncbi:MAG: thioredoxin family protein [Microthrixaceae bacterium]